MRKPISILLAIAMLLSVLSALTFTVSAEDEEEFTAVNLSLGYNIGMTYYTNIDYASDVTAHVTINGRTDTVKATNTAGKASFSFSGIAPHELGAAITAEIYKGNTATGATHETAVKDICALYLNNPFNEYAAATRAGIYKLVSNLLQYGEYARIYKGVTNSITSGISSANYVPDELSTPIGTLTTVESNSSLSLRGLSVFFDTTNRYYIKFATTDISKVRFTVGSTSYTEFGEEGGYYFFYTNPMSAKDTNNVVSIKGYYDNTKTIDLDYSIEQYIVDLAAVSASEGMQNLAKAIYNYSGSAESYTHLNFETSNISNPHTYTIVWKSQDGTVVYETDENVEEGALPSYSGSVPTKTSTAQYDYTFAGWSTSANQTSGTAIYDLPVISDDVVYYAAFTPVIRNYTVVWKSQDGSITYETDGNVPYGTSPAYNSDEPVKASTAQNDYTFNGWATSANQTSGTATNSLPAVSGNITYYATFTSDVREYTVTWKSQDGSITYETDNDVAYGTNPSYNSTAPTKAATAQYNYTFAGWATTANQTSGTAAGSLPAVSGNVTYYATFSQSVKNYTVTWKSQDGSVTYETDSSVPYGTAPSYNSTAPTKDSTAQYNYTFNGWATTANQTSGTEVGSLPNVTGNTTYYATFTSGTRAYTVTWKSQDGSVTYETDNNVLYGTAPSYNSAAPTKAATEQYTYTFGGWSTTANQTSGTAAGSLPTVSGNVTYYAAFSQAVRTYTVTINVSNSGYGSVNRTSVTSVPYGTQISVDSSNRLKIETSTATLVTATPASQTAQYTYSLSNWTRSSTSGTQITGSNKYTVTGNSTVYANFTRITRTYSVTWKSQDGNNTYETDSSVTYGTYPSYNNATPTKASTAQYTYTFAGWAASANQTSGTAAGSLPTVTANRTYYAAFIATPRTYNITYKWDDNTTITGLAPATYTYGTGATLASVPSVTDYTTDGWYTSSDCTGSKVTSISATETGNKVFYASKLENTQSLPVVDLTGTTWLFNTTVDPFITEGGSFYYYIDFDTTISGDAYSFESIGFNSFIVPPPPGGLSRTVYEFHFDAYLVAQQESLPVDISSYSPLVISITGGTDATNSDLISWLEANATQIENTSQDLTDTLWLFNEAVDLSEYFDYNVNFTAASPAGPLGTTSYSHLMVANDGPLSPVLEYGDANTRFYYDHFTDEYVWVLSDYEYVDGSGVITPFDARLIYFTGGTDINNSDLIEYMYANATLINHNTVSDLTRTVWMFNETMFVPEGFSYFAQLNTISTISVEDVIQSLKSGPSSVRELHMESWSDIVDNVETVLPVVRYVENDTLISNTMSITESPASISMVYMDELAIMYEDYSYEDIIYGPQNFRLERANNSSYPSIYLDGTYSGTVVFYDMDIDEEVEYTVPEYLADCAQYGYNPLCAAYDHDYPFIKICGGDDVTNPIVIAFFETNATQITEETAPEVFAWLAANEPLLQVNQPQHYYTQENFDIITSGKEAPGVFYYGDYIYWRPDVYEACNQYFHWCKSEVIGGGWTVDLNTYNILEDPDLSAALEAYNISVEFYNTTPGSVTRNETSYGIILDYAFDYDVTNMDCTFETCRNLEVSPDLPSHLVNLHSTYNGCWSLTEAPYIPSTVTQMESSFSDCYSLEGVIEIDANPIDYRWCFSVYEDYEDYIPSEPLILAGTSNLLNELAATRNIRPDVFIYGDYEYAYNKQWSGSSWLNATQQNGWGVRVTDKTKSSYGEILSSAYGEPVNTLRDTFCNCTALTTAPTIPDSVTDLRETFINCTSLTTAPEIPSGVTNMNGTFSICTSLTTAPEIPSSVTDMSNTFRSCNALTGTITINANPTSYNRCFDNCGNSTHPITLTGSSTMLEDLRLTGNSQYITVTQVIEFYIDGSGGAQLYFAEEGMTWIQWVNSEYNTSNYYCAGASSSIYAGDGSAIIETSLKTHQGFPVASTAVIKSDGQYYKAHSGGACN